MCDIHNKFKQQNAEEAVKPLEISQLQSKVVSNVSELKGTLCLTNMLSRKAQGHQGCAGLLVLCTEIGIWEGTKHVWMLNPQRG